MEEYLTTAELSGRIKMSPGTIRNLIWKKEFMENTHFVKPTPRKLLFIWSGVERWLYRNSIKRQVGTENAEKSLINI